MSKKVDWNHILIAAVVAILAVILIVKMVGKKSPVYKIVCEDSSESYQNLPGKSMIPQPGTYVSRNKIDEQNMQTDLIEILTLNTTGGGTVQRIIGIASPTFKAAISGNKVIVDGTTDPQLAINKFSRICNAADKSLAGVYVLEDPRSARTTPNSVPLDTVVVMILDKNGKGTIQRIVGLTSPSYKCYIMGTSLKIGKESVPIAAQDKNTVLLQVASGPQGTHQFTRVC